MKDTGITLSATQRKLIGNTRTKINLSQVALSKKIDCSSQAVNQVERGTKNVSFQLLGRICKALGLSCEVVIRSKRK